MVPGRWQAVVVHMEMTSDILRASSGVDDVPPRIQVPEFGLSLRNDTVGVTFRQGHFESRIFDWASFNSEPLRIALVFLESHLLSGVKVTQRTEQYLRRRYPSTHVIMTSLLTSKIGDHNLNDSRQSVFKFEGASTTYSLAFYSHPDVPVVSADKNVSQADVPPEDKDFPAWGIIFPGRCQLVTTGSADTDPSNKAVEALSINEDSFRQGLCSRLDKTQNSVAVFRNSFVIRRLEYGLRPESVDEERLPQRSWHGRGIYIESMQILDRWIRERDKSASSQTTEVDDLGMRNALVVLPKAVPEVHKVAERLLIGHYIQKVAHLEQAYSTIASTTLNPASFMRTRQDARTCNSLNDPVPEEWYHRGDLIEAKRVAIEKQWKELVTRLTNEYLRIDLTHGVTQTGSFLMFSIEGNRFPPPRHTSGLLGAQKSQADDIAGDEAHAPTSRSKLVFILPASASHSIATSRESYFRLYSRMKAREWRPKELASSTMTLHEYLSAMRLTVQLLHLISIFTGTESDLDFITQAPYDHIDLPAEKFSIDLINETNLAKIHQFARHLAKTAHTIAMMNGVLPSEGDDALFTCLAILHYHPIMKI